MAKTMYAVVCQYDVSKFVPSGRMNDCYRAGETWITDAQGNMIWGHYKPAIGECAQEGFKTVKEAQDYIKEQSQIINDKGGNSKYKYRNFIIIEYAEGDKNWGNDLKQYYKQ